MGDQPQNPIGGQALSSLYPTSSSSEFPTYPPSQHPLQQQQAQFNQQGGNGPVGGIPDAAKSAMWQQYEQNVKGGNAMTPQQFAAQLGTGGLGRAPVSVFIPPIDPQRRSAAAVVCSVRSGYHRIAHRAPAARTVRASSFAP